jgi:hypothetical protein
MCLCAALISPIEDAKRAMEVSSFDMIGLGWFVGWFVGWVFGLFGE